MNSRSRITLPRPLDAHLHLRDGQALATTVAASARQFGRAVIMPNLVPALTRCQDALAYRDRILAAVPPDLSFTPLMTLYLTEGMRREEIDRAHDEPDIYAVKLYPAGATTHSDAGVRHLDRVMPVLERMAELGLPLLIHGEVTDPDIDIFDREAVFIERVLIPLRRRLPELAIVLEHITTAEAVAYVQAQSGRFAATLTAHHLLHDRNDMLVGGMRPHFFCLPILKRREHRHALLAAATSGDPRFFLGTDSAPHARSAKENACACAGCFTAPAALELYASAFAQANALDRLADFASRHGAHFYGLPVDAHECTLIAESWQLPDELPYLDGRIVPFHGGQTLAWRLETER